MTVRLGVRGDAAVVAAMLARAFGDDPVFAWPWIAISLCVQGKGSPLATRNCHSTRSCPVIASVTGCSTCNRALSAALSAITAAVVGVILNLAVWFGIHTLFEQVREVPFAAGRSRRSMRTRRGARTCKRGR